MDSPEFSDLALRHPPHEPSNGKIVHYFGDSSHSSGLHHKAEALLLLLRLLTLGFSVASVVLMATNNHFVRHSSTETVRWLNFDAYRYVLAASGIIGIYSFAEVGLGIWYLCVGTMLMPASLAHWFDFGHDQGFAYLIFSACSAGTAIAHSVRNGQIRVQSTYACEDVPTFCTQAEIAIGMGFGAFFFIAVSSFLSGFRLAKWLMQS